METDLKRFELAPASWYRSAQRHKKTLDRALDNPLNVLVFVLFSGRDHRPVDVLPESRV